MKSDVQKTCDICHKRDEINYSEELNCGACWECIENCEIADCHNCGETTIVRNYEGNIVCRECAKSLGYIKTKKGKSVSGVDRSRKLTPEMVIEIRASNLSRKQLAEIYGCSTTLIWNVQKHNIHKNVK